MYKQYRKQKHIWLVVIFSTVLFGTVVFLAGCREEPSEQTNPQNQQEKSTTNNENPTVNASLSDIIKTRRYWETAFISWYGQMAPDFNLTDITGKQHRLSDYRGKNVMLIFWATWCPPCIREIPDLVELRRTIGEDKLAMLAVSYITTTPPNTTEIVKSFVERQKLNYTVLSVNRSNVSEPYNQVSGFPSSFFIDPEGKIKLATLGLLSLDTIKAILQAK